MQPFTVEPILQERVWGGTRIVEKFHRRATPGSGPIGESWELHGKLSIADGPWQGQSLDQAVRDFSEELFGPGIRHASFPILTKWLDCQDWLSLQVHPDDATARRLTGDAQARGKFECWYFVEVGERGECIHGWKDQVPANLEALDGRAWLDCVSRFRPQVDSWLSTPAGTVHALGPDLLLYEVQQSSDLTYRLYDWDRPGLDGEPRQLHIPESLESIRSALETKNAERKPGVVEANPYFTVEEQRGESAWQPRSMEVVVFPHGCGRLLWENGELQVSCGGCAVIPATARQLRVVPDGPAVWLRILEANK